MFFEGMTFDDFSNAIMDGIEKDCIERTTERMTKEITKRFKGIKRDMIAHRGQLHKTKKKNEYYTAITLSDKNRIHCVSMPSYMTEKGRVYLFPDEDRGELRVYGSHFLKRYRERYIKEDISLETTLLHASWDCRYSITIYKTEKQNGKYGRVDAVLCGLLIGDVDEEKRLYYVRTFVSDEMLQPIQRNAKNKINGYLIEKNIGYYLMDWNISSEYDILSASIGAQEIYKKYYSSCEDHISYLVHECSEDIRLNFIYRNKDEFKNIGFDPNEIPLEVQKIAKNRDVLFSVVLEKTMPMVYMYVFLDPVINVRCSSESFILYCHYSRKAQEFRYKDISSGSLRLPLTILQQKD